MAPPPTSTHFAFHLCMYAMYALVSPSRRHMVEPNDMIRQVEENIIIRCPYNNHLLSYFKEACYVIYFIILY